MQVRESLFLMMTDWSTSDAAVPIVSRGKADAGGWRRNVRPFEPQPGRCEASWL